MTPTLLELKLPVDGFRHQIDLKQSLTALGVSNIFSKEANFNKMTNQKVHVTDVIHESYLEVKNSSNF